MVMYMKGNGIVKNRWVVGLALSLALILAGATALAADLTGYFSGFAQMENAYGTYEQWPGEAKAELVNLMQVSGLSIDPDKATQLLAGERFELEREALAEEIIAAYYSVNAYMDLYNIMQRELGGMDTWSYKPLAQYTALLEGYGRQKATWDYYTLPKKGDISETEAIEKAISILSEKYGIADELPRSSSVSSAFVIYSDGDEPIWRIEFFNPVRYTVELSRTGDMLSFCAPGNLPIGTEDDLFADAVFVQPSEHDITEEQAVVIAKESLTDIGDNTRESLAAMRVETFFIFHERFNSGWAPVWLVYLYEEGALKHRVLIGYEGTCMDIISAGEEFSTTILPGENFGDCNGVDFFKLGFWESDVEDKASFSQKWIPLVNDFASMHPYYTNQGDLFYYATRYVYGVPTEDDLTQEEATEIARQAIVTLGAGQDTLETRSIDYYFDVTNLERPLWKLVFSRADVDMDAYVKDNNSVLYRVILDAKSGDVIEAWPVPRDMDIAEWRF